MKKPKALRITMREGKDLRAASEILEQRMDKFFGNRTVVPQTRRQKHMRYIGYG